MSAPRAQPEEVAVRSGDAKHVAERREDHAVALRDRVRAVDRLERGHAHRAARAMDELDLGREHLVEAVAQDRVGLTAADLHDHVRARGGAADLIDERRGRVGVAIFVEVLHGSDSPSSRKSSQVRIASSASIFAIAKPTWTRT